MTWDCKFGVGNFGIYWQHQEIENKPQIKKFLHQNLNFKYKKTQQNKHRASSINVLLFFKYINVLLS